MTELYFITICDDINHPNLGNLKKSLNNDLIILDNYDKNIGNLSKIFKLREYLLNDTQIKNDDIVIMIDAYDMLCIDYDKNKIIEKFKNKNLDLIVSAESNFVFHHSIVRPFFEEKYNNHKQKYINSGFIISYKTAYLKMLNHIYKNYEKKYKLDKGNIRVINSDQRIISYFMYDNNKLNLINMEIDCKEEFCKTLICGYNVYPRDILNYNIFFIHTPDIKNTIQTNKYNDYIKYFNFNKIE